MRPFVQKIGRQARLVRIITGMSSWIKSGDTFSPLAPAAKAPPARTRRRFRRQLPTTLPMARSVLPRSAATKEVINSGMEVPAETMVSPITASLTPRLKATALAPFTKRLAPKPRTTMPANRRTTALIQPCFAVPKSISGSAGSISSGSSRAVRISQTVLMTRPNNRATPDCQVTRPAEAIPQAAADTASRRGTSLLTKRLSTFRGRTRALQPSTTNTLKMLLPTTLLTASASAPCTTELMLTKNSGALVPSDTTVKPMTS